jgi:hypothetical protein
VGVTKSPAATAQEAAVKKQSSTRPQEEAAAHQHLGVGQPAKVHDDAGLSKPSVIAMPVAGDSDAQSFLAPKAAASRLKVLVDTQPQNGKLSKETMGIQNTVAKLLASRDAGGVIEDNHLQEVVAMVKQLIEEKMIPGLEQAVRDQQNELNTLKSHIDDCTDSKATAFGGVNAEKAKYEKYSPLHKECRGVEAVKFGSYASCSQETKDKEAIKNLKCGEFHDIETLFGDENANRQIVKKAGGESVESYLRRMAATICTGTAGKAGMLDEYLKHKQACEAATKDYETTKTTCAETKEEHEKKRTECDSLQDQMDFAACERAVLVKDACESYAECHETTVSAYKETKSAVELEENDRKLEYFALNRMLCLLDTLLDGQVSNAELEACKKHEVDASHISITYHDMPTLQGCTVPDRYPTTPAYKLAEFTTLPVMAKGKEDANECVGVLEISTKPKAGPATCKCTRVTMNGHYSAGPMVKCENCLDIRRSTEENSCPEGTKLFSPRNVQDWKTFLSSAPPLRDPYWIIDVTNPKNNWCAGCQDHPMNSGDKEQGAQGAWKTSDGSPWWLRSTTYSEPSGDYHADCFLDLWMDPTDENNVAFKDSSCDAHSKSYYCQPQIISETPGVGSPSSCTCSKVALTGEYSAGMLLKCTDCIDVRKSTQVNSCPRGTKLFAPASEKDWKTVIESVQPLRSPHFIFDVTRPQNGCIGCTAYAMNSKEPHQATWRTSDGAAWWLRSSLYTEPSGDYEANCYMDLSHPAVNSDSITFDDKGCEYHSTSYFCQPTNPNKKKDSLVDV